MIFAYVYDFVSFLFEKDLKNEIKSIVLYGSVASGEFDEKSDIDIFIDIWNPSKKTAVEKIVKEQIEKFEDRATRIWYPRGIKNNFSIIIGSLSSPQWKNMEYDMISNGMFLYSKYEKVQKNIEHGILMTFSLSKLKQQQKMKFIRELYGTKSKNIGLISQFNGIKISPNTIIVPIEKIKEFRRMFSKFKVTPQIKEIWVKS